MKDRSLPMLSAGDAFARDLLASDMPKPARAGVQNLLALDRHVAADLKTAAVVFDTTEVDERARL
jgi:hypothetical protein